MKKSAIIFMAVCLFCELCFAVTTLRQSTAQTITFTQPFVDWADSKTYLYDNNDFDPTQLELRITKHDGNTASYSLSKTTGDHQINLIGTGQARLTLTTSDTNVPNSLAITIASKIIEGISTEYIAPFGETFTVCPQDTYDAMFSGDNLTVEIASTSQAAIKSGLATDVNVSDAQVAIIAAMPSVAGLATSAEIADLNDISEAQVQAIIDGLTIPTLENIRAEIDAAIANMKSASAGFDPNTDSLEAIRNKIDLIPLKPQGPSF